MTNSELKARIEEGKRLNKLAEDLMRTCEDLRKVIREIIDIQQKALDEIEGVNINE